ncbi:MAG TPA: isovaleryl-CoA dehydrogenase [Actinomycetes bacterium]
MTRPDGRSTHEVTNQPPPLVDYNVFTADAALQEAVERYAGPTAADNLSDLTHVGRWAGTGAVQQWGAQANANPPVLHTHDRYGNRIDEVEFHPAWHELLQKAVGYGLQGAPWASDARQAAHLRRAAGFVVWSQVEAGHGCPLSMTYAAVPALRVDPSVAADWVPGLTALSYDQWLRPPAQKSGLLAGMGMTEKQGGSDVRSNSTRAEPLAEDGTYSLTGHKWFCSAPMCDVFLMLAQAAGGLTCFVVPRVLPDGTRNVFRIQRLKDKLGNRSNASAEIELDGTWARRLGDEGRGVATIIEMVSATRLDCVLGSTALMRQAVSQAAHHARHRSAFGGPLADKPLMRNVLADLAVESEAATLLAMRLAHSFDSGERDLRRLAVAVGKYWVCKRTPAVVGEALECLGGNGYVEESGLPRLYREAPLNSIWEGSGNVNALDVLRALGREPAVVEAFVAEAETARGGDARLDAALDRLGKALTTVDEAGARRLVELMGLVLQGSLLVRHSPTYVADAFCASRLSTDGADRGGAFGTLPAGLDTAAIVTRATPDLP